MSPSAIALIVVALLLISGSAFFSSSETAYNSVNVAQVERLAKEKRKYAVLISKQLGKFPKILTTILIANNLINILISTLFTIIFTNIYEGFNNSQFLITITTLAIATPLLITFGEIIPKYLAAKKPLTFLRFFAYPIEFFFYVFWIFTFPFKYSSNRITNAEIDLKSYVEIANREGVINHDEAKLISNAFELDTEKLIQHFVHLKEVTSVSSKDSVLETIKVFKESGFSRLPVKSNGKFLGMIHVSDLLAEHDNNIIQDYVRKIPYLKVNDTLTKALESLRYAKSQMAFITTDQDESHVIGIITMEDILEELVGEIFDERDEITDVHEVTLGKYYITGNTLMKKLVEEAEVEDFEFNKNETLIKWFKRQKRARKIRVGDTLIYKDIYQFLLVEHKKNGNISFEFTIK